MKRVSVFASLFALVATVACGGPMPGESSYGGLDTDGDGELTAADVEDGQVAVFLQVLDQSAGEPVEKETAALTTLDATITPGGSFGWYLTADLDGRELSLRFEGDFPLALGEGTITNASYDVDDEHFAYASEPGGAIEVTEIHGDGASASGRVAGEVELDVYDMMEAPIGESVRLEAFAFKAIPIELE